jgi:hypothetical protein
MTAKRAPWTFGCSERGIPLERKRKNGAERAICKSRARDEPFDYFCPGGYRRFIKIYRTLSKRVDIDRTLIHDPRQADYSRLPRVVRSNVLSRARLDR